MERTEDGIELATFAGGCFWCMVKPFDRLPGIVSVVSGYTGGHTDHPTYEEVGTETTGHAEAVQIAFRPDIFPYERLLDLFWRQIDPTDEGGQFNDRGASYRTAIFVHSDEQRRKAEASKKELQASGRFKGRIATEIVPAGPFYPAETEHQNYYLTHRREYNLYREASGRDEFLRVAWRRPEERKELRRRLTARQFDVTQNGAEEAPFGNEYWDNRREGLYVDVLNGDPLFRSADQYDAGDGWPAFARPVHEGWIRREADLRRGAARTAIRARLSNAFLGFLLFDGPEPDGLHYRIYSAALRFIPKELLDLEENGRYSGLL
ncbi:peptide-methionine (S)-S-oxide reductase MsrA [Cohnella zeiphila]|uniref:Peptide methionine sulfoxide reductase MsrA n=1 Tax=Cohnella zeiphila TaxID=2761120 RepID=A0A7X0SRA4_9BACL|nr:peptide-methionine (S)-S-oxide reductase MsrA [Cohnella zeiphila]MBB6733664.1 peptide-methionine (S)-S-oxide reductase MsrA [Cohnella zeiphila]